MSVLFADKASVPKELCCAICADPWPADRAAACPECEELFCAACIADRLLKTPSCPKCDAAIASPDELRKPPRLLRSMSERRVEVLCPFKRGCWRGPWAELAAHVAACDADPARVQYVGTVDEHLCCEICHEPAAEPLCAPCCEQLYCGRCVRQALQRALRCPHCNADLSEDLLAEAPKKMITMLDALQVRCATKCGWTGPRVEEADHRRNECPAIPRTATDFAALAAAAAVPAPAAAPAAAAAVAVVPVPPPAPVIVVPSSRPPHGCGTSSADDSGLVKLEGRSNHPWLHAAQATTTATVMAHVTAPAPTPAMKAKRKALHISAAMDISGSMRGEKLQVAKSALEFVVQELHPEDRFGLIAFDDRVETVLDTTGMNQLGKDAAAARIRTLTHRGSTNLSGGLFAAIAQARDVPVTTAPSAIATAKKCTRRVRVADPAASNSGGFLSRAMSYFSPAAAAASAAPPVSMPPPPQPANTMPPGPPKRESVPAFDLTVKFNASPMKQNNAWLARYSFEVGSALPQGVSHVAVVHDGMGRLTLRGRATFGLTQEQNATFGVEVYLTGDMTKPHAVFRMPVAAEDGAGECKFAVPAYTVAPPPVEVQRSRIVLLFTDGMANAGITDPQALVARTREIIAAMPDKDVTVFTFGFGANHNGTLLQQIAEVSQGSYFFVNDASKIREVFADCLGGLLSMVASGIQLKLTPGFGCRVRRALTRYPTTAPQNDGSVVVTIKDLYAEEVRDVLVELDVAPRAAGPAVPVATWSLVCENVVLGRPQTFEVVTALETRDEAYTGAPDREVDLQLSRFRAAEAMAAAQELADRGDVAQANAQLAEVHRVIKESATSGEAYSVQLQTDLCHAQKATVSAAMWQREGQKRVSRMKSSHAMQRANFADDDEADMYQTAARSEMRRKAK